MSAYDAWKTQSPYDDGPEHCPQCQDGILELDSIEQSVSCDRCDYAEGKDWGVDDAAL